MIHEIYPREYRVQYVNYTPRQSDTVLFFDDEMVYCRIEGGEAVFPRFADFSVTDGVKFIYLFSIDEERFFLPDPRAYGSLNLPEGYEWQSFTVFRRIGPRYLAFAAVTAQALYQWYRSNVFCGRCGAVTTHAGKERACVCTECGQVIYPKISPVVIVAVTNGENLLVTRYRDRPYRNYALVAGFAESGEPLEDTVRREVYEETGVRVKNIKYYKSQPWGFTSTLLSGFFCELDGDPEILMDENELSEALWLKREDIPPADSDIALTAEMMEAFRTSLKIPYACQA